MVTALCWVGLSALAAYAFTTAEIHLGVPSPELMDMLSVGPYTTWPRSVFLLWMLAPFLLALGLGARAIAGSPEGVGRSFRALTRTGLSRLVLVLAPWLLTPSVLAQEDGVRRGAMLATLLGWSFALAVYLRPEEPPGDGAPGAPAESVERGGHRPMLAIMAVHFALFGYLTIVRDRAHWSATVDLGIFKEALWNTLHGRVLFSPTVGYSFLGEHFSPVLFLLVPLYALSPTSECLLLLQVGAITLSAWPLYLLGVDLGLGRRASAAVAAAMIFCPPMHCAVLYDWHMDLLAVPALSWLLLALHRGRWGQACAAAALMAACKEDMFLVAGCMLLAHFLARREPKERLNAAALAVVMTAYCAFAMFVLLKRFGPPPGVRVYMGGPEGYKFLRYYAHLAGEPGGPVAALLRQPFRFLVYALTHGRLTTVLVFVGGLGFLPLLAPRRLPMLFPLALMLLSDNPELVSLGYHYGAIQHPGMFALALYGGAFLVGNASRPQRARDAVAAVVTVGSVVLNLVHPTAYLARLRERDPLAVTAQTRRVDALAAQVPPGARISAATFGGAMFSNRPWVGVFPEGLEQAEYVQVDLQRPAWPISGAQTDEYLQTMLRSAWGVVDYGGGAVLLRRGADRRRNEEALRALFLRRTYEVEGTQQTSFPNCVERDPAASDGRARVVWPTDPRPPGWVVHGPEVRLPRGRWTVRFRLKAIPTRFEGSIGRVDVYARGRMLAQRELAPGDFPDRGWRDIPLGFESSGYDELEFRVRTDLRWVLGADVISLRADDEDAAVRAIMEPGRAP